MIIYLIESLFSFLLIIVGIGFVTLVDRNLMGYSQNRKSPNKVGMFGILQSVLDGIKLMMKEWSYMDSSSYVMFMISPVIGLVLMMFMWSMIMMMFEESFNIGMLFLISLMSLNIFSKLFIGYSSSKMSVLGSVRSLMQTMSYELVMSILLYIFTISLSSYSLNNSWLFMFMWNVLILIMWMIVCLSESVRIPFDLVEGESELISGYNTEYSSMGVIMIFMSEYGSIMFLSMMSGIMFGYNMFMFLLTLFVLLWFKSVFPRIKYDMLMGLLWLSLLPMSTLMLVLFVCYI